MEELTAPMPGLLALCVEVKVNEVSEIYMLLKSVLREAMTKVWCAILHRGTQESERGPVISHHPTASRGPLSCPSEDDQDHSGCDSSV